MGFYTATCMMSRLPIKLGDPCVGFLIAFHGVHGPSDYPTRRYVPISPGIHGTYDGGGGVTIDENNSEDIKCIKLILEMKTDRKIDSLSNGRLSIAKAWLEPELSNRGFDDQRQIAFVLIRKSMYDFACKYHSAAKEYTVGYNIYGTLPVITKRMMDAGLDFKDTAIVTMALKQLHMEWEPMDKTRPMLEVTDEALEFYRTVLNEAEALANPAN